MQLDQFSILTAVGISVASLGLTLFMMWVGSRSEAHLLHWAAGLGFIVCGVALFGHIISRYDANLLLWSFVLLIGGFALIYTGSIKFCSGQFNVKEPVAVVTAGLLPTVIAFAAGYSGIGVIAGNLEIGILLAFTAYQYWSARSESPALMTSNALLLFLVSASFVACGYALAAEGKWVLEARPANWAEDLNSIAAIIGLSGIGTLSLALNQVRIANRHKRDAMTDALTGLMNRRALSEAWRDTVPSGTAVVVMDLDHFKAINDRFGHDAGDEVLRHFGQLIRDHIRPKDIAARIGGEEFCIVMPSSSPASAAVLADRVRTQIEAAALQTASGVIQTTVSAGLAYAAGPQTIHSLISRADAALYEAKAAGRNRVRISELSLAA